MTALRHKTTIKGLKVYYICQKVRTLEGDKVEILDAPSGYWYYKGTDLGFTCKTDAIDALKAYERIKGKTTAYVKKIDDDAMVSGYET